jgi:hypothetical protein
MKNWKAAVRTWMRNDKRWEEQRNAASQPNAQKIDIKSIWKRERTK